MKLNPQIDIILSEHHIDRDLGKLALLGLYYGLDITKIYSEETVKMINLTKIIDKDYRDNTLKWNIPLFEDGSVETSFAWVSNWMEPFGKLNPERRGVLKEVLPRMKKFFAENPSIRKEDVYAARDAYFKSISDGRFMQEPHYFIFKGVGLSRVSGLLKWVSHTRNSKDSSNQKGKLMS